MTALAFPAQQVVRSHDPRTVTQILHPATQIWLHDRPLFSPLQAAARRLLGGPDFVARATLPIGATQTDLDELLGEHIPDRRDRRVLGREVAGLLLLAARAMRKPRLQVRVDCLDSGRCPVFHEDQLPLRMLAPLAGPGTEWVHEPGVRRNELGLRGRTPKRANAAIAPDPRYVEEIPAGTIAVLKGAGSPGAAHGVVHRSPGRPGRRLLVVIDDGALATDPDEHTATTQTIDHAHHLPPTPDHRPGTTETNR